MKIIILSACALLLVIGAVIIAITSHKKPSPPRWTITTSVKRDIWTLHGAGGTVDSKGRLIMWGAMGRMESDSNLTIFTPATSNVDLLSVSGKPPVGLVIPGLAFDTRRNILYVFGGWPQGPNPSDELFQVDLSTPSPRWKPVAKTAPWPPGRNGAVFVYDKGNDRLLVAAGDSALDQRGMFHPLGDLWQFSLAHQAWSQISPRGDAPPARWHPMFAIDDADAKLYMIGGAGVSPQFDRSLYELDLKTDTWRRLPARDPWPPSLQGATLTLDSSAHALVLAGGLRHQPPGPAMNSEIWVFDIASQNWQHFPGGDSSARRDHLAIYDPISETHYLFGGQVSQTLGNFYERGQPVSDVLSIKLTQQAGPNP